MNTLNISNSLKLHFKEIKKILDKIGEPVEGNFICHTTTDNLLLEKHKEKIFNLQSLVKNKKNICEIGFNAGHSLLLMIDSNPDADYQIFDLGEHKYARPCLKYIKTAFPNTKINCVFGDSKKTLKDYFESNNKDIFDFFHVDGGHGIDEVESDFYYSSLLTKTNSVILFDDYNHKVIKKFLNKKINENKINEIENYIKTKYHLAYRTHNE